MLDSWDIDMLLVILAALSHARGETPDIRAVLRSLFRLPSVEQMTEPQKRVLVTIFAPLEAEQLLTVLEEEYAAEVTEIYGHSHVDQ